jgi:hypothetical protein
MEEHDHGAGLIHQTIPELAETEPRPNKCPDCVNGLQHSTWVDEEQPMRLCSTCDGCGEIDDDEPCDDGYCLTCGAIAWFGSQYCENHQPEAK